ncbi:cytochrome P450 [Gordonia alkaliphila]|uniref:cytochrome P450 n=1 Tax=Gordonia alkaliphila TaxID=1053547 RepID=UPI001FF1DD78|nr:cytochrome P450 [Gordonia alkaliphila]MCK0439943.1 cytochrome P450 [Gordonia alkaliphila]
MKLDSRLPHPGPRVPLLGDVFGVDRNNPTQHEMTLAERLGPIFERKLLDVRLVLVAGGELAGQCNDEDNWARALAGPTLKFRGITGSGLFTAKTSDPLWGQARRVLEPGFAQSALRTYHAAMQSVADDLIEYWSGREVVDVHTAMTNATLEVIARAGFSRNLGLFTQEGADPQAQTLLVALDQVLTWASESTNDLPVVGQVRGLFQERAFQANLERTRAFIDGIVADRVSGKEPASDDLLGLMLDTVDPDTGEKLPHQNVRDQVLTFLVAGHETTAALLEVTLWYLAARPGLAQQVTDEARTRGFDYSGVAGMRTTRNILNESLRLWPPVPGIFRVSRKDQQLGGYDIPAGYAVFVLTLAAQRDPEVWGPTAAAFDPERWEAKALREYPDRYFTPFGTGPRSCIGRAFAMQESALLVSRICDAFELSLAEPAAGSDPEMTERGTLRPVPFSVKLSARAAV